MKTALINAALLLVVAGTLCLLAGCLTVQGGFSTPYGTVTIGRDGKRTVIGVNLDGKSIVRHR